ncbi:Telomerase Cajal body protein 1 [Hypsizygus marmoreus]|uniref:Telomerase Cajal body protein 1 n=1 Tax=Hypsizygus marmoreus TaxID=39966 RepID=A0A369J8M5_HYPMA|nr:Telomerase Cajal body protein 1 [Hypsizygus marmoreus]
MESEYTWSPPQYNVSKPPRLQFSQELAQDEDFPENFARTVKWCPDGSTFLAQCENRTFQLFNTFPIPTNQDTPALANIPSQTPTLVLPQPSPILEFLWYPSATPLNPASFCFLASVRECPVKLLDASDGRLRASYRIVDHRERQIAPHSLAFNITADKIYCGFEDAVEVFDVLRPGEGTRLSTTPSKKSKDGLKGIISALAFAPSHESDFYAAGSLTPSPSNIAMFSEAHGAEPVMYVSGGPRAGVMQIHFNPTQPHIMYASYRRHSAIYSWDLRANVDEPVNIYRCNESEFEERTNQKMRFDVDLGGRWLSVGDQHGKVSLFDHQNRDTDSNGEVPTWTETLEVLPSLEFPAHKDAVGSVAFNPVRSVLLSASGSRHFHPNDDDGDDHHSDDSEESENEERGMIRRKARPHPVSLDSSIKLWSFDDAEYHIQL